MTNPYPEWEYRVDIDISNPSSTDGFQAKIDISFLSGMQADFDDIRFASLSGVVVPYWIETKTDSTTATVWLKLPASASNVYMYYGNDAASSESDGDSVFELFDDFEAETLDGSKWDTSGTVTVSSGTVSGKIGSKVAWGPGYTVEFRAKGPNDGDYLGGWATSVDAGTYYLWRRYSSQSPYFYFHAGTKYSYSDLAIDSDYHRVSLSRNEDDAVGTVDGHTTGLMTSYSSADMKAISFGGTWEWVMVRKYAATDPTLSVNESSIVYNGVGAVVTSSSVVSCGIYTDPISESGSSQSSGSAVIAEYITVDATSQSTTGTPSVDDSIPISVAGISGVGNFPLKDYIQLNNYNIETVDISRSISDSMWELTANIENVTTPKEYSHIDFSAVDADGTTQQMFTGLIPSSRYVLQAAANKSSITAYDYGFYLSKQKINYSELTMDLNGSYDSWDAWVTHLLDNTGIDAYKINSCSAADKEIKLNADTSKLEAIKKIAEHCGFIFYVGWINYGTVENPDLRPSAYFVDVDDIDDAVNGLDLPAAVTVTWPDDSLAHIPLMDTIGDEDYNRVIVRGMDSSGTWYTSPSETAAVTAGDEWPREYYEEAADWNSQAKADARAAALLTYFTTKVYKVQANFQKRFDLKLWQKIKFEGAEFPATLTGMGWLRIISIRYHHAPANDTVTIEALPDRDMNMQLSRINAAEGDDVAETEILIDTAFAEQPQVAVGSVTAVSGDGSACTVQLEDGNTVTARVVQ